MPQNNRDDFTKNTVLQIAKRAGFLCSFPSCRAPTVGATSDGESEINIGTAAHICAAAPGGPRYDEKMSQEERSSAKNGIHMCRDHGTAIDSKDPKFTVELLREWKKQAEKESWQRVLRNKTMRRPTGIIDAQLLSRVQHASKADLNVFKKTAKWPSTSVALTLEVNEIDEPMTTDALAMAVISLDDLILVAPPGMGKTTTLFQIAEGILSSGSGTPMMVPLGDWATEGIAILDSILKRPAFKGVSEEDIRKAATIPGVVLFLDGWNELDDEAKKSVRVQVTKLKAELPELSLIVSTRRQVLDVPFVGKHIDLMPLSEEQQMQIAVAIRGDIGRKFVDQAWRTAGLRELMTIPLYLTALLSLPENSPFPTTKEEVLRHFVAAQEMEVSRAEALRAIAQGFQQNYLESLAIFATRTANTAIGDTNARRLISETDALLINDGQITNKSQPNQVLDVLVSNHVLMRAGDIPGYSFQHQQFQEWYASHLIERRIITEIDDPKECEALKAEVLNLPVWEEAILFAVERLAHGTAHQRSACGKAIIAAFEVDPILAAEMIYRSTEDVWVQVADSIQNLVTKWHEPGKSDRAFRFMLMSGRSEFFDKVWPLIIDEDDQISLNALRNCRRFRTSVLGKDAEKKIKTLSQKARKVLLYEIASRSDMDGLDLVSAIAKNDPDPEVQAFVVDALAFRHANRHIAYVLQQANDKTFDLIASKGLADKVDDELVNKGIIAARKRLMKEKTAYDRLRVILYAHDKKDYSKELTDIISTMEIKQRQDAAVQLIYELQTLNLRAVSDGLLNRVLAGRTLFYGADDILASAGLTLESDTLLKLVLSETSGHDDHAEAAASVLGPQSVGLMIDALYDLVPRLMDENGRYNKAINERFQVMMTRINHVPAASLVAAVQARSAKADTEKIVLLATLLSRDFNEGTDRSRAFNEENLTVIRTLVEDWGIRTLSSGNAERNQVAKIAVLASCAPSVNLLPILKRMLDDNLQRYRVFRKEAEAAGWQQGNAVNEARSPCTYEYRRAFLAIDAPETAELMKKYLTDPHFGELAAHILSSQWMSANEPLPNKRLLSGTDFSQVREKRAVLTANPNATSSEAEAIFKAIETLTVVDATDDQKYHASMLAITAVRLPHGQRQETIKKLIALTPRRVRCKLLTNLILSGAEVDSSLVTDGIAETFEAAKKDKWMLSQNDGYELREWLRLLPFTTNPKAILDVLENLPDTLLQPHLLEGLLNGLSETPSESGEEVLFKLAEKNPHFYQSYEWGASALKLSTASSARRLVDLVANGVLPDNTRDHHNWSRGIGLLISEFPEVRSYVYDMLKSRLAKPPLAVLTEAVSENPDIEGLLLLVNIADKQKTPAFIFRAIENVITEHVPLEGWGGAYDIVPRPVTELRQKLLAMVKEGGPTDIAAHCLHIIDTIRDEYGQPASEPRHPDLACGKQWPIMTPVQ